MAWGGLLLWKFIPGPDSHNAASGSWPMDHICCVHVMILLPSGFSSLTLGPGKYQSLVGINHPAMVRIDTTGCSLRFLSSAIFFFFGWFHRFCGLPSISAKFRGGSSMTAGDRVNSRYCSRLVTNPWASVPSSFSFMGLAQRLSDSCGF